MAIVKASLYLSIVQYAERFGLAVAYLRMLSVRNVCGSNLSHSAIGKPGCNELDPALK